MTFLSNYMWQTRKKRPNRSRNNKDMTGTILACCFLNTYYLLKHKKYNISNKNHKRLLRFIFFYYQNFNIIQVTFPITPEAKTLTHTHTNTHKTHTHTNTHTTTQTHTKPTHTHRENNKSESMFNTCKINSNSYVSIEST